jgi:hypothetical protein
MTKRTKFLIAFGVIFASLTIIFPAIYNGVKNRKAISEYPYIVYRGNMELKLQESKGLLVDEVNAYIARIAPTSNLNGRILVELCDEYNRKLYEKIAAINSERRKKYLEDIDDGVEYMKEFNKD